MKSNTASPSLSMELAEVDLLIAGAEDCERDVDELSDCLCVRSILPLSIEVLTLVTPEVSFFSSSPVEPVSTN